jgi:UDP-N-acetylmuramoylalanine-D-glutamate ligase
MRESFYLVFVSLHLGGEHSHQQVVDRAAVLSAHFLQICYRVLSTLCKFEIVSHRFELLNIVIIDNGDVYCLLNNSHGHIYERCIFN